MTRFEQFMQEREGMFERDNGLAAILQMAAEYHKEEVLSFLNIKKRQVDVTTICHLINTIQSSMKSFLVRQMAVAGHHKKMITNE